MNRTAIGGAEQHIADGQAPAVAAGSLKTPVGELTVLADDDGLRRVGWRRHSAAGRSQSSQSQPGSQPESQPESQSVSQPSIDHRPESGTATAADLVAEALRQLAEYFAGDRREFDLPVSLAGLGDTTVAVLTALRCTVGFGQTVTYGELAARSGTAVPARAIGSIMGSNPVPIVIPCHRVVASDGLGGYSGGEPGQGHRTKLWLLEHEGALPPALI